MAKATDSKGKKSRLGRGLSSLMQVPDTEPVAAAEPATVQGREVEVQVGGVREISPNEIDLNPHQPRKTFSGASLSGLAASLKSTGVIQPLVVRPKGDGRFELIAGERRLRASKLAKLETVPVVVKEVASPQQAEMALVENIQREDLNPVDRAEAYAALLKQLGLTQSELASRLGEERSGIANHLRLLDLADPVKEVVRSGGLSLGHAKVIAGVADEAEQARLADLVMKQQLSVRNLERLVKGDETAPLPPREASDEKTSKDRYLSQLGETISQQMGTQCTVKSAGRNGYTITLHMKNAEQFDAVMTRLDVSPE